jgi:hypothetical protein
MSSPQKHQARFNFGDNWQRMPTADLGRSLRRYQKMRSLAATPAAHEYARHACDGISLELRRRDGLSWAVAS